MTTQSTKRKGELFAGDFCRMERFVQLADQWFFDTREGIEGPFVSMEQANISLEVYLRKLSGRALLEDTAKRSCEDDTLAGTANFMDFSDRR
jgi:hypothetical protein